MSAGDNDETGLDRVREACRRAGNDWTGAEAVAGIERYNQAIREELRTAGDALAADVRDPASETHRTSAAPAGTARTARCFACGHVVFLAGGVLVEHFDPDPEPDQAQFCYGSRTTQHEPPDALPPASTDGGEQ